MNFRIAALLGALSVVLTACPPDNNGNDGGTDGGDGGPVIPVGGCTGGCGPNEVCDEAQRKCVPGCNPGCSAGELCVNDNGTFECITPVTSCGGNICGEGQTACVSGNCSCLPAYVSPTDTCTAQGRICPDAYNPVTMNGGACEDPKLYEFCLKPEECPDGNCGTCGAGQICDDQLFNSFSHCVRSCMDGTECGPDERCFNPGVCFPFSVTADGICSKPETLADGGVIKARANATDPCLLEGQTANDTPTGTCSWIFFKGDTRSYAIDFCRSPGPVPEFGACKTDQMPLDLSNSCGTGLECMPVGEGNDGICLRICDARAEVRGAPTGCNTGESCANIYRIEDFNTEVGVCLQDCSVFSTAPDYGCTALGSTPSSCVPTSPSGTQVVSTDGSGICIPQIANAAAEGQQCALTDPLEGAACQTGLVCTLIGGEANPRCVKPCDVGCIPSADGGTPDRCDTEANATCGAGQECTRVTGTTGALVGYCL